MKRQGAVLKLQDSEGQYEIEVFDCKNPKRVIVCAHGNGVRRWDGAEFFYKVAEHFVDATVILVDQNQPEGNGVRLNPLPILVARVNAAIDKARELHSNAPLIIMGHSMGCGVVSPANVQNASKIIFVTPACGAEQKLIGRYGPDIARGKVVTTSDGLIKHITAEYCQSIQGIVWEDKYKLLLQGKVPVYAFEAQKDEIVGEERFQHRDLPFTRYKIIPEATHNLSGEPLEWFLTRVDETLASTS